MEGQNGYSTEPLSSFSGRGGRLAWPAMTTLSPDFDRDSGSPD